MLDSDLTVRAIKGLHKPQQERMAQLVLAGWTFTMLGYADDARFQWYASYRTGPNRPQAHSWTLMPLIDHVWEIHCRMHKYDGVNDA
jgi:hypothetical protein